jgi:MFS transporter, putative metabolite:H+ symporter
MVAQTYETIVARIERLPDSRWHTFVRVVLGSCTFFDAYDVLVIAFVLPVLAPLWHLAPPQIGLLLSAGFAGQLIGATVFGWIGERYGRIATLKVTIIFISVFGFACAFASGYWMLVAFRFLQGLGIGGEPPMGATYVSEISKAKARGRFVALYQLIYPVGLMAASLISRVVVPNFGWQWVFVIGALPALMIIPIRRAIPESPRWLARKGRVEEADRILTAIENSVSGGEPLPPLPASSDDAPSEAPGRMIELFEGRYGRRTLCLWLLWACAASTGYGLVAWLPTFFAKIYQLSVQDSLTYAMVGNLAALVTAIIAAFVVDRTGRKPLFAVSYFFAAVPLLVLVALSQPSAMTVLVLAAVASASISATQLVLWVYTPENYPTRIRAFGVSTSSAVARGASMLAPIGIGFLLGTSSIAMVFLGLAIVALIGTLTVLMLGIETTGRTLEELSPDGTGASNQAQPAIESQRRPA